MKLRSAHRSIVNGPWSMVYRLFHFLPLRTLLIIGLMGFGMTGCRPTQPVSSTETKTKIKTDSTVTTIEKKDSVIHTESIQEKTLAESIVDFKIAHGQRIDSIIAAIKAIPKGVPQVITIPDKIGHAKIQLLLDSIGNLTFRCISEKQTYYERYTQDQKYKSDLVHELNKKNSEVTDLKSQILQMNKSLWQRLKDSVNHWIVKSFIWLLLLLIMIIVYEVGLAYIKKVNPLSWVLKIGSKIFGK